MISLDEYQIIETGERMCYKLQSVTKPQKPAYRVDLIANGGASECSCKDWSTRRGPAIKAGEPIGTRRTLCKHGILARRHFLNALLKELSKQEREK